MDPWDSAWRSLADADFSAALRYGWRAATNAARTQDDQSLTELARLADEVVARTEGAQHADAQRLGAYCRACLTEPRDPADGFWGLGRLFSRGQRRKTCPDCAESIALNARLCRFCGYRYPDLASDHPAG